VLIDELLDYLRTLYNNVEEVSTPEGNTEKNNLLSTQKGNLLLREKIMTSN
jgi:hypothetical protein